MDFGLLNDPSMADPDAEANASSGETQWLDPKMFTGDYAITDNNSPALTEILTGTGDLGNILKGIFGTKAGSVAGTLGVAALANKLFGGSNSSGGFAGYQGKIPTYTASRTMNTIPTTMTVPKTGGGTEVVPRRPGLGGVTYFSPMVYTPASTTTVAGGGGNDTVEGASGGMVQGYAPGGIVSLAGGGNISDQVIKNYITNVLGNKKSQQEQAAEINAAAQNYNVSRDQISRATGYGLDAVKQFLGPNIIGQKTRQTPYQLYDKASDTYRYVDAVTFENWLNGIPLTPPNPVPNAPVYNGSFVLRGAGSTADGYPDIGGYNPITMQDNSLDIQDFDDSVNRDTLTQAFQNDVYAPEGLIANEVVNRAVEEFPSAFDPRNIALRNEINAIMSGAKNQFFGDVMSVDQITGEIDPIQSLRNIVAYEPSIVEAAPGLRELQSLIANLNPESYEATRGISGPYGNDVSPEDIRHIQSFGQDYRNMFNALADVLENKSISPSDYTDNVVESTPNYAETTPTQQPSIFQMEDYDKPSDLKVGGKRGGAVNKKGIASLMEGHLGSYSDGGRLLRGPGDGVSDDIPATIGNKQPARLADGEFVIPARIVSELGNGSTEAGARKLYAMMDRIKKARRSTKDIAADTKTDRYLPR